MRSSHPPALLKIVARTIAKPREAFGPRALERFRQEQGERPAQGFAAELIGPGIVGQERHDVVLGGEGRLVAVGPDRLVHGLAEEVREAAREVDRGAAVALPRHGVRDLERGHLLGR